MKFFNEKNRRIIVIILAIILAAAMVLALVAPAFASDESAAGTESTASLSVTGDSDKGTILNGIHIGGTDVSGLTKDEAVRKINDYISGLSSETFTVSCGSETRTIQVSDLGFSWDPNGVVDEAVQLGKSGDRKSVV